jgi:monofunctional biosynthetic peptidoglycan transglycosylase
MLRRVARWTGRLACVALLATLLPVLVVRFVDPPVTPLMLLRVGEGLLQRRLVGIQHTSVALDDVSPALLRAVIAAEDGRFFEHHGIDWAAVRRARAWNARHPDRPPRGASTITMQCARSTFLWPGRTWIRKGIEAWLATLMELTWPKRRILEVYVNVVEWGDGVYGAEAAAEHWFDTPATRLDARQAALLAVVLPAPTRWSPVAPSRWVAARAAVVGRRAADVRLAPLALPRQRTSTGPGRPHAHSRSTRAHSPVA